MEIDERSEVSKDLNYILNHGYQGKMNIETSEIIQGNMKTMAQLEQWKNVFSNQFETTVLDMKVHSYEFNKMKNLESPYCTCVNVMLKIYKSELETEFINQRNDVIGRNTHSKSVHPLIMVWFHVFERFQISEDVLMVPWNLFILPESIFMALSAGWKEWYTWLQHLNGTGLINSLTNTIITPYFCYKLGKSPLVVDEEMYQYMDLIVSERIKHPDEPINLDLTQLSLISIFAFQDEVMYKKLLDVLEGIMSTTATSSTISDFWTTEIDKECTVHPLKLAILYGHIDMICKLLEHLFKSTLSTDVVKLYITYSLMRISQLGQIEILKSIYKFICSKNQNHFIDLSDSVLSNSRNYPIYVLKITSMHIECYEFLRTHAKWNPEITTELLESFYNNNEINMITWVYDKLSSNESNVSHGYTEDGSKSNPDKRFDTHEFYLITCLESEEMFKYLFKRIPKFQREHLMSTNSFRHICAELILNKKLDRFILLVKYYILDICGNSEDILKENYILKFLQLLVMCGCTNQDYVKCLDSWIEFTNITPRFILSNMSLFIQSGNAQLLSIQLLKYLPCITKTSAADITRWFSDSKDNAINFIQTINETRLFDVNQLPYKNPTHFPSCFDEWYLYLRKATKSEQEYFINLLISLYRENEIHGKRKNGNHDTERTYYMKLGRHSVMYFLVLIANYCKRFHHNHECNCFSICQTIHTYIKESIRTLKYKYGYNPDVIGNSDRNFEVQQNYMNTINPILDLLKLRFIGKQLSKGPVAAVSYASYERQLNTVNSLFFNYTFQIRDNNAFYAFTEIIHKYSSDDFVTFSRFFSHHLSIIEQKIEPASLTDKTSGFSLKWKYVKEIIANFMVQTSEQITPVELTHKLSGFISRFTQNNTRFWFKRLMQLHPLQVASQNVLLTLPIYKKNGIQNNTRELLLQLRVSYAIANDKESRFYFINGVPINTLITHYENNNLTASSALQIFQDKAFSTNTVSRVLLMFVLCFALRQKLVERNLYIPTFSITLPWSHILRSLEKSLRSAEITRNDTIIHIDNRRIKIDIVEKEVIHLYTQFL